MIPNLKFDPKPKYFFKNHSLGQFQQIIAQNNQLDLKLILRKNFWFGVKFQIWDHLGSNFEL